MGQTVDSVCAFLQKVDLGQFADLDGNLLISNDRFRGVTVANGRLVLPDAPGLGLEVLKDLFQADGRQNRPVMKSGACKAFFQCLDNILLRHIFLQGNLQRHPRRGNLDHPRKSQGR